MSILALILMSCRKIIMNLNINAFVYMQDIRKTAGLAFVGNRHNIVWPKSQTYTLLKHYKSLISTRNWP